MSPLPDETHGPTQADDRLRFDISQDEFDRHFYGRILGQGGSNPDVLRRQAELLSRRGDYHGALPLDRKLAERFPRDFVVRYNLACSLAMTGQISEAISSLNRALDLGYDDFEHLESDADLDALRDAPGFHELLRRYGIGELP